MRIRRIQLTNFRQHADSTIAFQDGITGVLGTNGAGKSTVLEGIAYALYGADAIRGTKGTIRWTGAPARRVAEVVLDFEMEGQPYTLWRTETNARLALSSSDEQGEIVADGTSAVSAFIPKLLGMGWKEFASSYLTNQKDLMRLATMGPTERQTFYREVMGVGRVDEALKAARQQKSALTSERDGIAAGLGEREPLETDAAESAAAVESASEELAAASDRLHGREEQAKIHRATFDQQQAKKPEYERLSREIAASEEEITRTSAEVDKLTAKIEAADAAGERAESRAGELETLPNLRQRRDDLLAARARLRELAGLRESEAQMVADVAEATEMKEDGEAQRNFYDALAHEACRRAQEDAQERLQALVVARAQDRQAAEARATTAAQLLQRERRKADAIRTAGENGACPTCKRALGSQFADVLAEIDAEIAELERVREDAERELDRINAAEADVVAIEAEVRELAAAAREHTQKELDATRGAESARRWAEVLSRREHNLASVRGRLAAAERVEVDPAALASTESEIGRLEELAQQVAADRALAAQRPELVQERARWVAANSEAVNRGGRALVERQRLGYDAVTHEAIAMALGEADRAREAAKMEHARAEGAVSAATDRQTRAARALEAYDARASRLVDLTEQLRLTSAAAERLAEFRVAVASGIRPEMEELVSGFVGLLTDGRYEAVTISEDFSCTLYRAGVPVEVISGGEEDVVAVAMRLATSQMIAERAGHPLSLLILDEVFGSLDEVRRANALALFRRLRGVFPQIILISHIPESQHQVDQAVYVEFDEARGCSRIIGDCAPQPTEAVAELAGAA